MLQVLAKVYLLIMAVIGIICTTMVLWAYKDIGTIAITVIASVLTNMAMISLKIITDDM